ncbi:hypothetical protein Nepgr_003659 [Nepenthes gracilis]|uniref:Uncharacterized protein n=1 Tax=Nepenthes gracilis TaxID=150966 RepID=A0AAD3RZX3_NEPGR|nr:hypothetical protein Nepgr_003659 [Nepenthes gracilis]
MPISNPTLRAFAERKIFFEGIENAEVGGGQDDEGNEGNGEICLPESYSGCYHLAGWLSRCSNLVKG